MHSYKVTLAAGQFLRAVVDQRGINLIVTLYDPDGKKLVELDSPVGAQGPEPVSLVAKTSGSYRLELRSWHKSAPKGRYEVRIEQLRPAAPQDEPRVAAERAFAEATLIAGQETAESQRKAIEKYRETVSLWQALGDRQQEAYTLTAIGYVHASLAEYQKALDYYNQALPLSQGAGDRHNEATTLYNIGLVHDWLAEQQRALDFYNQALQIHRVAGNRSMEAATLGNMGVVYSRQGQHQKALEFFNRALVLKRDVGDPSGEATLLNNIGLIHSFLGEPQKALELYNQALPILRVIDDRSGEATTLNNIAKVYDDLGEPQKALDLYNQVVQIKRATGHAVEEAIALSNIGVVYISLGEHRKALDFFNQSLPLSRAAGARSTQAVTLSNIGKAYGSLGEHQRALDFYNQALSIQRAIGGRRGEAITLTNIGRAYGDLGEHQKALDYFNQALPLTKAVGDRSSEAVTLYNTARVQGDLNNLTEARTQIEAALTIVESLRTKVANAGLRTSYLASVQRFYELGIDLLMRLHKQQPSEGFDAAALQTSERARGRTLLELLMEARADIRQGVPPALIERERSLQQLLDSKAAAQTRLLSNKHTAEQAATAAKEVDRLATDYEDMRAQIRQSSPRYAALTQPQPLSLKEIQTQVLDGETLLLEYALGDQRSFLWAVTPTSITSFELPKQMEVEAVARRFYDLLTTRNQFIKDETPEQRRLRFDLADAEYPKVAAALSQMLLAPVASQLGTKRLVIVGDGVLQYVPFAALPSPVISGQGSGVTSQKRLTNRPPTTDHRPLMFEHEVVCLPSASVLAVLRKDFAARKPAAMRVAVLADPVFHSDDPRFAQSGRSPAVRPEAISSASDVKRSASESGLDDFVRLRFSRLEAEQITRFAPDDRSLKALDFAANRETATSADIGQYAIVHFATHGLINSRHPELSGIVLSLVDKQGRPQNGFLRLHEVYNLRLGADLVVLSACQTALGKEVKGEGLIGLTRGFMYAGAPRVVASLCRIDDRATADLMRRFYQGMLAKGLRPAAALREAQVSMWKDKRWGAPYYWAAFTLQGEWNNLSR